MTKNADYWIKALELAPHPEGGFFRETYRSSEVLSAASLPSRFDGDRAFSTAIFFLLPSDHISVLHRIRQDELWHFHAGSSLKLHILDGKGEYGCVNVGDNMERGHVLQAVVKAGCVFGAEVAEPNSYALVGCTVAPGFDFADFEMPSREELVKTYPGHDGLIRRLTRP